MSRKSATTIQPGRVAVLRAVGERIAVLVAESRGADAPIDVIATHDVGSGGELAEWLGRQSVARVVAVIPPQAAIGRMVALPAQVDGRAAVQALRLQAEEYLLAGTPAHRVASALLPERPGAPRQGFVVSWPTGGGEDASISASIVSLERALARSIGVITEASALAALVGGTRLTDPLVHASRRDGAIAVALDGPSGLVLRTTREQANDDDGWHRAISRVLLETALASGLPTSDAQQVAATYMARPIDVDRAIHLPEATHADLRSRLRRADGSAIDDAWLDRHALDAGAALAALGPLAPLASLRAREEEREVGFIAKRLADATSPRVATQVVLASLLLVALVPLASAMLRRATFESKLGDLDAAQAKLDEVEDEAALYRELSRRSWPMTKLLGDLANCTPEGIEFDTIRIDYGDVVAVRGRATPQPGGLNGRELVNRMSEMLADSGVFKMDQYAWDPEDARRENEFSMRIRVEDAYRVFNPPVEDDFGITTLAIRRYGDAARGSDAGGGDRTASAAGSEGASRTPGAGGTSETSGTDAPRTATPGAASADAARGSSGVTPGSFERRPSTRGTTGSRGSSSGLATRGSDSGSRSASSEVTIPEPLTQEQIDVMTKAEAQAALSRVALARQRAKDVDEATMERLTNEFKQLLERTKVAE